jgi:polyisoprenoid-binding protein YceI
MMGVRTDFVAKATINRHDFGLGQGVTVRFAASSLIISKLIWKLFSSQWKCMRQ